MITYRRSLFEPEKVIGKLLNRTLTSQVADVQKHTEYNKWMVETKKFHEFPGKISENPVFQGI